ncbi:MAG: helix-turn-helix domain-containing protein [Fimbriimonadales bacterium]
MDGKDFYTVNEVAAKLALGKTATYQLINAGRIRTVRFGSAVRVSAAELERFEKEVVEVGSVELGGR